MKPLRKVLLGAALGTLALGANAQEVAETNIEDQTAVAVTAYNSGIALIRDVRKLKIGTGEFDLRFSGVAEQIRPETVALRSLSQTGSLSILEQNYEYDLISPSKLMEKFVGQSVKLINVDKNLEFIEKDAKLLSVNESPVYEIEGKIYLGHPGSVVLPEIPANLAARPSLVWKLNNTVAEQEVEASYLTNGISWSADYVLSIPKDESSVDIAGWITMNNQSGATYNNAKLKLVAGSVNVAPQMDFAMMKRGMVMAEAAPAMAGGAVQEAFGEYHLYTIPRPTTIKQNQSKQIALMDAAGVKFTKKLEFPSEPYWYMQQQGEQKDLHAKVRVEFENKKDNALGIPLPAGVMRLYQEDSEGSLQFLGEDRIQHTPKDETIRLNVGEAFDVVADRRQMDFQIISDRVHESEFEVIVRNRKETPTKVEVVENIGGDWEILKKSHDYTKRDAFTVVFPLSLDAGEEVKLSYRVRTRH